MADLGALAKRKIGGIPAWAWGATFVVMVAYVVYRRRQQAAAELDEPIAEDPYAVDGSFGGDLGYVGGGAGEEGYGDVLDGLDNLSDLVGSISGGLTLGDVQDSVVETGDVVLDRLDGISDELDTGFEGIGETIKDGYNIGPGPYLPMPMPTRPPPPSDGQLPPAPEKHGCPAGYRFDESSKKCVKIELGGGGHGCPKGWTFDTNKKKCVPISVQPGEVGKGGSPIPTKPPRKAITDAPSTRITAAASPLTVKTFVMPASSRTPKTSTAPARGTTSGPQVSTTTTRRKTTATPIRNLFGGR